MIAIVQTGPESVELQSRERPVPADDEVLVEVEADFGRALRLMADGLDLDAIVDTSFSREDPLAAIEAFLDSRTCKPVFRFSGCTWPTRSLSPNDSPPAATLPGSGGSLRSRWSPPAAAR